MSKVTKRRFLGGAQHISFTSFTLVTASNLHQLFPNQLQNTHIYLVTSGYQGALASIGLCECSFSDWFHSNCQQPPGSTQEIHIFTLISLGCQVSMPLWLRPNIRITKYSRSNACRKTLAKNWLVVPLFLLHTVTKMGTFKAHKCSAFLT